MRTTGPPGRFIGVSGAVGVLAVCGLAALLQAQHANRLPAGDAGMQWSLVDRYCIDCHNATDNAAGIRFDQLKAGSVTREAEIFETAAHKLRGRLMPPPGSPQPSQRQVDTLVSWIETAIDGHVGTRTAGHVPIKRLNRTEFANAVEALLAVEIDPAEFLPAEVEVEGFSNIASALTVSPSFLEQHVRLAREAARLAVGEREPELVSAYFPPPELGDQDGYVAGMPPGTRGGTRFEYTFPADGEYRINLTDLDIGLYPRGLENEQTLVILIDREEVFRQKIGGAQDLAFVDRGGPAARQALLERFQNIPVEVTAGPHEVIVTFIERARINTDNTIRGGSEYAAFLYLGYLRLLRVIGGIEVVGPYRATNPYRTPSRRRLFVCEPEAPEAERACAERITANLAEDAFRRPVTPEDTDRLMAFYDAGREADGAFDAGIRLMVAAVLVSPDFLYQGVAPPSDAPAGESPAGESLVGESPSGETHAAVFLGGESRANAFHELTDLELASRLSFFLWGSGPDDELLEVAAANELRNPEILEAQTRRMLAAPQAESLVTTFAYDWLNLDDLDEVQPDRQVFAEFTPEVRADIETEIDLFLRSVLLEDRNVQDLLTADYTFLNERLARHYGIDTVHGPQFRRVTLVDDARWGLLGKGAVLLRTSYGDRTSPVLRGAWVLEKLVGTPPSPPPPNVETDLTTPPGEQPKTVRARLEEHREEASCNFCHGVIDPYGLPLENFTVTGQWRDADWAADAPIDASTILPSLEKIEGPSALRRALLSRPDQFVQAFTEKLMMYALGRELEYHDMPQVRSIVGEAERRDYRFSAIVTGIVSSHAFRMQAASQQELSEVTAASEGEGQGGERGRT